jgi:glycosyltransferase involved in cell wall biosynthesis
MRILFLSTNYPPDIGPGALRSKSIIDALVDEGPSNLKIDVITTMPNRYHSFRIFAEKDEIYRNVSIKRIILPTHKNGFIDQTRSFISFSLKVKKLVSKKKYNVVVSTSSRLMTASLSAWIAKNIGSKLYLDIRDLFTDTMDDILFRSYLKMFMPMFRKLEKWTFNSADKINIVSPGFLDYLKKISPILSPSVYTNGIDEEFFNKNFSSEQNRLFPLILYTGNIGSGQGLHKILPKAVNELKNIKFKIIGDGSAKKLLSDQHLFQSTQNIEFLNPMPRKDLINEYQNADILFIHLNDHKAFHKVLPSKIFEYAATGKPILAGISGYAAEFFSSYIKGSEVFNPCDVDSMKISLQKLLKGPKIIDRRDFCLQFSRKNIMKKFANDVLTLL